MWEKVRLKDVTNVITCGVAKRPEYIDTGIMFLSSKNVKANSFFLDEFNTISYEDYLKLTKNNKPEKGDILYTRVGSFGEAAVIDFDDDFAIFVSLTLIKPKHKVLFNRYLMHYLNSEPVKFHAINNTTGIGVQNLNVSVVREYLIPLPPIETQRQITNILDKTNEILAFRKIQLEELDNLIKSVFYNMFGDLITNNKGWKKHLLGDIAEIVSGITKGRKLGSIKTVSMPYMRVANVKDGYLDLTEIKNIDISERELKQYTLKKGDILLTEGGDPDKLGRGAVWMGQIEKCVHQNHIFRVRINSHNINPDFLSMLIGSDYGKRYFLKAAKQTTGIASINMSQLKKFPALLPPLPLQTQFATIVEKIEEQKALVQKALDESQYLFDSLMDKYFGE